MDTRIISSGDTLVTCLGVDDNEKTLYEIKLYKKERRFSERTDPNFVECWEINWGAYGNTEVNEAENFAAVLKLAITTCNSLNAAITSN